MFDLLFGTLHNPRDLAPENGCHDGASLRAFDTLAFRDVAVPAQAADAKLRASA